MIRSRGVKMDYSVAKWIARSRENWTCEQLERAAITLLAQFWPSETDLHDAEALRVRAIQLRGKDQEHRRLRRYIGQGAQHA